MASRIIAAQPREEPDEFKAVYLPWLDRRHKEKGYGHVFTYYDFLSFWQAAVAAERESCALLAEQIGEQMHSEVSDPQGDLSEETGEKIAAAIRSRR
jgi:hypothetical protein